MKEEVVRHKSTKNLYNIHFQKWIWIKKSSISFLGIWAKRMRSKAPIISPNCVVPSPTSSTVSSQTLTRCHRTRKSVCRPYSRWSHSTLSSTVSSSSASTHLIVNLKESRVWRQRIWIWTTETSNRVGLIFLKFIR